MEISKHDWALYRCKMPVWQENYMEHLCREYVETLTGDEQASDRFWRLWERIITLPGGEKYKIEN